MVVSPVLASFSIKSIFVASGIDFVSFCSPSRGPTSTILTRLSNCCCCCWPAASVAVANPLKHRGEVLRRTCRVIGLRDFILVERHASPWLVGRFDPRSKVRSGRA